MLGLALPSRLRTVRAALRGSAATGFIRYIGPALIVSTAYIDPGNFGTDIAGGAQYAYQLLWVVWLANIMAMVLQYLSGKLGLATSLSLAEIIRGKLRTRWKIVPYWLACEIFAVFTDLAEFLGVTIGLYLLFGIPLIIAAFISAFDIIVIFFLTGNKFRRMELIIANFVTVIGLGYLYEVFITKPNAIPIAVGSILPLIPGTNAAVICVGVIGATVMPHALVLHSYLAKNKLQEGDLKERKRLLGYHRNETLSMLTMAGCVNAAILIMASAAFNTRGILVATIQQAYWTLLPLFGFLAGTVFAITLLCSGWSSSCCGVLAGQAILEGMLGSHINPWVRRIIIRVINVAPTTVMILLGFNPLTLLVYSQVVLSFLIPLPLIPLIIFTMDRKLMGNFVNRKSLTAIALLFCGIIIAFNIYILVLTL
ncbi:MAG: Nramp family divalent metal transporter [Candidatus Bathyarchaeia archaeon]|jgi:manganese transport protein